MSNLLSVFKTEAYDLLLFLRDQKRPLLFTEINNLTGMKKSVFRYYIRLLRDSNLIEYRYSSGTVVGYVLSAKATRILNEFEKSILTYMEFPKNESITT